ncbi:single-stranded-DNA-specific exonuclease RecJ [Candidatus Gottesmanbacteria bacterium]|nr:single-stranded-DNA-specific exonuclease RecJ [Candidatus Gottesmanbacteria bacterium]
MNNRGLKSKQEIDEFLHPRNPYNLDSQDVGIDTRQLKEAAVRIKKAIDKKESIVVYADYDADGITAGAIMWETLHNLGATVMPYIPHRAEEGYGLSIKGIDAVVEQFDPTLIITVDHGITAWEKVAYAKKLGIDVIVTDHHVKPKKLPRCTIVHTVKLSGAGVSWFLAKELVSFHARHARLHLAHVQGATLTVFHSELLALAAIGTIADMVPLVGPNRSIAKYGLAAINKTNRVGLEALIEDTRVLKGTLGTYEVSHMLAPRLNAMGRIEHALDALRLLCTKQKDKATLLAQKLGLTNRERQQLTLDTTAHALQGLSLRTQGETLRKLLFVVHESYNQGVIGLVAGKLVEEYYRPTIVVAKGEKYSKASARSIAGFNIVEVIRSCSDILVDVGGHPMAAGFTVETKYLSKLQKRLEAIADKELDEEALTRTLRIDAKISLELATEKLWQKLRDFEPFGFGNPEPVFATRAVKVVDTRLVGNEGKHLKLRLQSSNHPAIQPLILDAIAFNLGNLSGKLKPGTSIDIAYTIDMNVWNGDKRLQLKIKDIHFD